ncbi:MAG: heavy-metal-associated domain-containing protein [Terriglobales bacterium]
MHSIQLKIEGMSCGHCVAAVEKALDRTPGVLQRSVNVGSATVEIDPARVTPEALVAAISTQGFTAQVA